MAFPTIGSLVSKAVTSWPFTFCFLQFFWHLYLLEAPLSYSLFLCLYASFIILPSFLCDFCQRTVIHQCSVCYFHLVVPLASYSIVIGFCFYHFSETTPRRLTSDLFVGRIDSVDLSLILETTPYVLLTFSPNSPFWPFPLKFLNRLGFFHMPLNCWFSAKLPGCSPLLLGYILSFDLL